MRTRRTIAGEGTRAALAGNCAPQARFARRRGRVVPRRWSLVRTAPARRAHARGRCPSPAAHRHGDRRRRLACDRRRERADAIRLRPRRRSTRRRRHEPGVGRCDSDEPLQARRDRRCAGATRRSHADLDAVQRRMPSRRRAARVILDLRAPARRASQVTAQPDGSLQVDDAAGTVTVRRAASLDGRVRQPRTARAAADAAACRAVDRLERSPRRLRTLCAALDRDVFPYYELLLRRSRALPVRERPGLLRVRRRERPGARRSTAHRGAALRRASRPGRAEHDADAPLHEPVAVRSASAWSSARGVLLVRDAQGIWRLATIEPLLPLVRRPAPQRRTPTPSWRACIAHGAGRARKSAGGGRAPAGPARRRRTRRRRRARAVRSRAEGRPGRRRRGPGARARARATRRAHAGLRPASASASPRRCVALRVGGRRCRRASTVDLRDERAARAAVSGGRRARARAGRVRRRRRGSKPMRGRGRPHLDRRRRRRSRCRSPLDGSGRRDARRRASASCRYSDDARVTSRLGRVARPVAAAPAGLAQQLDRLDRARRARAP